MRVQQRLQNATVALADAGIASPRADAVWLICHVYGLSPAQLLTVGELPDGRADLLNDLIALRAQGIPLQHLIGSAPFRHLDLAVGPGVFIPRPETELIVDLAAESLRQARTVVDLGAGSGAIALAVANEYPSVQVVAVEGSAESGDWLRRNAAAQIAAGDPPVRVVINDISQPGLLAELDGKVDVVLSNPPYVPTHVRTRLSREVAHDPAQAVFAGTDGLDLMPALIAVAARLLRPGGLFAVEHDDTHGEAVPALLKATGDWRAVADHPDLAGRPRFATGFRC